MVYEDMRLKRNGAIVRVYDISNNIATIFDPELYQKRNNGWSNVKISQLVPLDFPIHCQEYVSKTQKNKAKSRLQLIDATWKTTNGLSWKHKDIEKAIQCELAIMKRENIEAGE